MKYCTHCGNQASDTANFCTVCGTAFRPIQQELPTSCESNSLEPCDSIQQTSETTNPAETTVSPAASKELQPQENLDPDAPIPEEIVAFSQPTSKQVSVAPSNKPTQPKEEGNGCVGCLKGFVIILLATILIVISYSTLNGSCSKEAHSQSSKASTTAISSSKSPTTSSSSSSTKPTSNSSTNTSKAKSTEANKSNSKSTNINTSSSKESDNAPDRTTEEKASKTPAINKWPEAGLATLLPKPEIGNISTETDTDELLYVKVRDISKDDFNNYINNCILNGFNFGNRKEGIYHAVNKDRNYHITVRYGYQNYSIKLETLENIKNSKELNIDQYTELETINSQETTSTEATDIEKEKVDLLAYLDKWDAQVATSHAQDPYTDDSYATLTNASKAARNTINNAEATSEELEAAQKAYDDAWYALKTISSTANTVTPSFKKSMDEYEAFFDQYIAFMQTVASGDFSMSDYLNFMSRYSKAMEAVNSVNQDSLSLADQQYYIEVMTRINTKLASVSLGQFAIEIKQSTSKRRRKL